MSSYPQIIVCLVIVVVSGCTSSSSTGKNDDNYISFNYPSYMTIGGGNNSGGESIEGHAFTIYEITKNQLNLPFSEINYL